MSTNPIWLSVKLVVFFGLFWAALYFVVKKDPFHYRQHAQTEEAGTLKLVSLRGGASDIYLADGRHLFVVGNVNIWQQGEKVLHPVSTVNGSEEIDTKQWCVSDKCYPEIE